MTVRRTLSAVACLLVLTVALPAAAEPPSSRRIINGDPSQPGAWPSMTALITDGSQFCGGSLISPDFVLTAAHCIVDDKGDLATGPEAIEVIVGSDNLEGPNGELLGVAELIPHPGYDPLRIVNDIALLRLSASSSQPVQQLVAPGEEALSAPGATVTVTGFGATEPDGNGESTSSQLLEASFPAVSDADCAAHHDNLDPERMLCAGAPGPSEDQPGVDSCQGDSGGPLVAEGGDGVFRQVGVVSFGGALCGVIDPGVYAEVVSYLDWIGGIVDGEEPPAEPDPENPAPVEQGADATIYRVASDAAATEAIAQAVTVSEATFFPEEAEFAVLARADVFADALGGSSLGFGLGPLLFTGASGGLAPATRDELQRVVAPGGVVYVLGGPSAVPVEVDDELAGLGFDVARLAGGSREETAAAVANEVVFQWGNQAGGAALDTVMVATRENWPDAVAAGQIGSWWGVPVLLTPQASLHPAARDALAGYLPSTVLVVGGTGVVSDGVVAEIESVTGAGSVTRLGGATRTETAARVLDYHVGLFGQLSAPEEALPQAAVAVNLRRADAFAHVLSASMLTGAFGAVFVPVEGDAGDTLTPDVAAAACGLDIPLVVAGGRDLVAESAAAATTSALAGDGC